MKILINASILDQKLNGLSVYSIEVIKKLVILLEKSGIEYEIYSYPNTHLNFIPNRHILDIKIGIFNKFFLKINRSIHRIIWNRLTLKKIARNFDLVYCPSSHGNPFVKKQIITIHDLICFAYPSQNIMQYLYFKLFLPKIAKNSSIIAISEYTKSDVLRNFNISEQSITTIYNGADHLLSVGDIDTYSADVVLTKFGLTKNNYFLTVGASLPHKNVVRLVEASKKFESKPFYFVVVGSGKYLQTLRDEIKGLDSKNMIILTNVSNEELSILYQECIANIYLSFLEGFGFPPIEAACYNKVSIVARASCLPEIYGDAALFVNPYSIEDIQETIDKIINGRINLDEFDTKLKGLVDKYKWEKAAIKIMNLINTSLFSGI